MIYSRKYKPSIQESKNAFRIRVKVRNKHKNFRASLNKWHKQARNNALMIKSIINYSNNERNL